MKRLRRYDVVLLAPPAWRSSMRQIACHVVAVDGAEAALEPLDTGELGRLPAAVPDMFMTFMHDGKLVALKGDLVLRRPTGNEDSLAADLRFRVTDGVHEPARDASRLPLCAPVSLTTVADDGTPSGEPLHTQTVHVTGRDMLVEDTLPVDEPGSVPRLEMALSLPGGPRPVEGVVRVVRSDPSGSLLAFDYISRFEHGRLVTFIFDCHREALRMYKAEQRLLGYAAA